LKNGIREKWANAWKTHMDHEALKELRTFLQRKASEAAPRPASLFNAVVELLPEILALRRRRYTDLEIRDLLKAKGVEMSLGTFRQYVQRAIRQSETGDGQKGSQAEPQTRISDRKRSEINDQRSRPAERGRAPLGHRLNEEV
jgi:hypothetical protein